MSLEGAHFICLDEAGNRGKVVMAKGRKFTVGYYVSCDFVLADERAKGEHCTIESDAFGRITIRNMSTEYPIIVNKHPVVNKINLFNKDTITILDKQYLWEFSAQSAKEAIEKSSEEISTPQKQIGVPDHSGFSSPGLKTRKAVSRFTVHNFAYCIQSDDEGNTSIESNKNDADAENAIGIEEEKNSEIQQEASNRPVQEVREVTPEPESKITTITNVQETPKMNLINCTVDKENTTSTKKKNHLQLSMCHQSDVVITSFSPRETGVKPEKSFTAIIQPKVLVTRAPNTPKSVYSTPKSVIGDNDHDDDDEDGDINRSKDLHFHTPSTSKKAGAATTASKSLKNSSMHLVDYTTPSRLAPASPYLKSALKASAKKLPLTPSIAKATVAAKDELGISTLPITPIVSDDSKSQLETPSSVQSIISVDSTDTSSVIEILSDESTSTSHSAAKTPQKKGANKYQATTPMRTPQSLMKRAILTSTKKQGVTTPQRGGADGGPTTPRREPINRIPLRSSIGELKSPVTPKPTGSPIHTVRRLSMSTPTRKIAAPRFESTPTSNTKFATPSARKSLIPISASKAITTSTPLGSSSSSSNRYAACKSTPLNKVRKSIGGIPLSSHISKARKSIIAAAPANYTSIKEKSPQQKMSDRLVSRARKSGGMSPMIARAVHMVQAAKATPSSILKQSRKSMAAASTSTPSRSVLFAGNQKKEEAGGLGDRSRTFILGSDDEESYANKMKQKEMKTDVRKLSTEDTNKNKHTEIEAKTSVALPEKEKCVNITFSPEKEKVAVDEENTCKKNDGEKAVETPVDVEELPQAAEIVLPIEIVENIDGQEEVNAESTAPLNKTETYETIGDSSSTNIQEKDDKSIKSLNQEVTSHGESETPISQTPQASEESFAEVIAADIQEDKVQETYSELQAASTGEINDSSPTKSAEVEIGFGEESVVEKSELAPQDDEINALPAAVTGESPSVAEVSCSIEEDDQVIPEQEVLLSSDVLDKSTHIYKPICEDITLENSSIEKEITDSSVLEQTKIKSLDGSLKDVIVAHKTAELESTNEQTITNVDTKIDNEAIQQNVSESKETSVDKSTSSNDRQGTLEEMLVSSTIDDNELEEDKSAAAERISLQASFSDMKDQKETQENKSPTSTEAIIKAPNDATEYGTEQKVTTPESEVSATLDVSEQSTTCKLLEEIEDVLNKSDEIKQKHLLEQDDEESIPTLTDEFDSEKLTQESNLESEKNEEDDDDGGNNTNIKSSKAIASAPVSTNLAFGQDDVPSAIDVTNEDGEAAVKDSENQETVKESEASNDDTKNKIDLTPEHQVDNGAGCKEKTNSESETQGQQTTDVIDKDAGNEVNSLIQDDIKEIVLADVPNFESAVDTEGQDVASLVLDTNADVKATVSDEVSDFESASDTEIQNKDSEVGSLIHDSDADVKETLPDSNIEFAASIESQKKDNEVVSSIADTNDDVQETLPEEVSNLESATDTSLINDTKADVIETLPKDVSNFESATDTAELEDSDVAPIIHDIDAAAKETVPEVSTNLESAADIGIEKKDSEVVSLISDTNADVQETLPEDVSNHYSVADSETQNKDSDVASLIHDTNADVKEALPEVSTNLESTADTESEIKDSEVVSLITDTNADVQETLPEISTTLESATEAEIENEDSEVNLIITATNANVQETLPEEKVSNRKSATDSGSQNKDGGNDIVPLIPDTTADVKETATEVSTNIESTKEIECDKLEEEPSTLIKDGNALNNKLVGSVKTLGTPKRRSRRLSVAADNTHDTQDNQNVSMLSATKAVVLTENVTPLTPRRGLRRKSSSVEPESRNLLTPAKHVTEADTESALTPRRSSRRKSTSIDTTVTSEKLLATFTPKRNTRRASISVESETSYTPTVTNKKSRRASLSTATTTDAPLTPKRITRRRSSMSLDVEEVVKVIQTEKTSCSQEIVSAISEEINEDMGAIIEEDEEAEEMVETVVETVPEDCRHLPANRKTLNVVTLDENEALNVVSGQDATKVVIEENVCEVINEPSNTLEQHEKEKVVPSENKANESDKKPHSTQQPNAPCASINEESIEDLTHDEQAEVSAADQKSDTKTTNNFVCDLTQDEKDVSTAIQNVDLTQDEESTANNDVQDLTQEDDEHIGLEEKNISYQDLTQDEESIQITSGVQKQQGDVRNTEDTAIQDLTQDEDSICKAGVNESVQVIEHDEGETVGENYDDKANAMPMPEKITDEDDVVTEEDMETLEVSDDDSQYDYGKEVCENKAEPSTPKQQKSVRIVADSPKTPVLTGMRELLQTPKPSKSTPKLGGIRHLVRTPKLSAQENEDEEVEKLQVMQAMVKTPNCAESLRSLPNEETNKDLKGVKELLKTPQSCSSPRFKGMRELMQTPKLSATPGLAGVKELLETPARRYEEEVQEIEDNVKELPSSSCKDKQVYGVEESLSEDDTKIVSVGHDLMKTPKGCSTPRYKGMRELLKTPKVCSTPALGGLKELMNTPRQEGDDMDKFLKTPTAKNIMIPTLPLSAVIEKSEDSVEMVHSTEYDLNITHEGGSANLEELFKTPVASRFVDRLSTSYCEGKESVEDSEDVDKSVEVISVNNDSTVADTTATPLRKSFQRKSFALRTPHQAASPFSSADVLTDISKADAEEWMDNIDPLEQTIHVEDHDDEDEVEEVAINKSNTYGEIIHLDDSEANETCKLDDSLSVVPETCAKTMLAQKSTNVSTSSEVMLNMSAVRNTISKDPLAESTTAKLNRKEKRPITPIEAADISGINLLDETAESALECSLTVSDDEEENNADGNKTLQNTAEPSVSSSNSLSEDVVDDLSEPLLLSDDDDDDQPAKANVKAVDVETSNEAVVHDEPIIKVAEIIPQETTNVDVEIPSEVQTLASREEGKQECVTATGETKEKSMAESAEDQEPLLLSDDDDADQPAETKDTDVNQEANSEAEAEKIVKETNNRDIEAQPLDTPDEEDKQERETATAVTEQTSSKSLDSRQKSPVIECDDIFLDESVVGPEETMGIDKDIVEPQHDSKPEKSFVEVKPTEAIPDKSKQAETTADEETNVEHGNEKSKAEKMTIAEASSVLGRSTVQTENTIGEEINVEHGIDVNKSTAVENTIEEQSTVSSSVTLKQAETTESTAMESTIQENSCKELQPEENADGKKSTKSPQEVSSPKECEDIFMDDTLSEISDSQKDTTEIKSIAETRTDIAEVETESAVVEDVEAASGSDKQQTTVASGAKDQSTSKSPCKPSKDEDEAEYASAQDEENVESTTQEISLNDTTKNITETQRDLISDSELITIAAQNASKADESILSSSQDKGNHDDTINKSDELYEVPATENQDVLTKVQIISESLCQSSESEVATLTIDTESVLSSAQEDNKPITTTAEIYVDYANKDIDETSTKTTNDAEQIAENQIISETPSDAELIADEEVISKTFQREVAECNNHHLEAEETAVGVSSEKANESSLSSTQDAGKLETTNEVITSGETNKDIDTTGGVTSTKTVLPTKDLVSEIQCESSEIAETDDQSETTAAAHSVEIGGSDIQSNSEEKSTDIISKNANESILSPSQDEGKLQTTVKVVSTDIDSKKETVDDVEQMGGEFLCEPSVSEVAETDDQSETAAKPFDEVTESKNTCESEEVIEANESNVSSPQNEAELENTTVGISVEETNNKAHTETAKVVEELTEDQVIVSESSCEPTECEVTNYDDRSSEDVISISESTTSEEVAQNEKSDKFENNKNNDIISIDDSTSCEEVTIYMEKVKATDEKEIDVEISSDAVTSSAIEEVQEESSEAILDSTSSLDEIDNDSKDHRVDTTHKAVCDSEKDEAIISETSQQDLRTSEVTAEEPEKEASFSGERIAEVTIITEAAKQDLISEVNTEQQETKTLFTEEKSNIDAEETPDTASIVTEETVVEQIVSPKQSEIEKETTLLVEPKETEAEAVAETQGETEEQMQMDSEISAVEVITSVAILTEKHEFVSENLSQQLLTDNEAEKSIEDEVPLESERPSEEENSNTEIAIQELKQPSEAIAHVSNVTVESSKSAEDNVTVKSTKEMVISNIDMEVEINTNEAAAIVSSKLLEKPEELVSKVNKKPEIETSSDTDTITKLSEVPTECTQPSDQSAVQSISEIIPQEQKSQTQKEHLLNKTEESNTSQDKQQQPQIVTGTIKSYDIEVKIRDVPKSVEETTDTKVSSESEKPTTRRRVRKGSQSSICSNDSDTDLPTTRRRRRKNTKTEEESTESEANVALQPVIECEEDKKLEEEPQSELPDKMQQSSVSDTTPIVAPEVMEIETQPRPVTQNEEGIEQVQNIQDAALKEADTENSTKKTTEKPAVATPKRNTRKGSQDSKQQQHDLKTQIIRKVKLAGDDLSELHKIDENKEIPESSTSPGVEKQSVLNVKEDNKTEKEVIVIPSDEVEATSKQTENVQNKVPAAKRTRRKPSKIESDANECSGAVKSHTTAEPEVTDAVIVDEPAKRSKRKPSQVESGSDKSIAVKKNAEDLALIEEKCDTEKSSTAESLSEATEESEKPVEEFSKTADEEDVQETAKEISTEIDRKVPAKRTRRKPSQVETINVDETKSTESNENDDANVQDVKEVDNISDEDTLRKDAATSQDIEDSKESSENVVAKTIEISSQSVKKEPVRRTRRKPSQVETNAGDETKLNTEAADGSNKALVKTPAMEVIVEEVSSEKLNAAHSSCIGSQTNATTEDNEATQVTDIKSDENAPDTAEKSSQVTGESRRVPNEEVAETAEAAGIVDVVPSEEKVEEKVSEIPSKGESKESISHSRRKATAETKHDKEIRKRVHSTTENEIGMDVIEELDEVSPTTSKEPQREVSQSCETAPSSEETAIAIASDEIVKGKEVAKPAAKRRGRKTSNDTGPHDGDDNTSTTTTHSRRGGGRRKVDTVEVLDILEEQEIEVATALESEKSSIEREETIKNKQPDVAAVSQDAKEQPAELCQKRSQRKASQETSVEGDDATHTRKARGGKVHVAASGLDNIEESPNGGDPETPKTDHDHINAVSSAATQTPAESEDLSKDDNTKAEHSRRGGDGHQKAQIVTELAVKVGEIVSEVTSVQNKDTEQQLENIEGPIVSKEDIETEQATELEKSKPAAKRTRRKASHEKTHEEDASNQHSRRGRRNIKESVSLVVEEAPKPSGRGKSRKATDVEETATTHEQLPTVLEREEDAPVHTEVVSEERPSLTDGGDNIDEKKISPNKDLKDNEPKPSTKRTKRTHAMAATKHDTPADETAKRRPRQRNQTNANDQATAEEIELVEQHEEDAKQKHQHADDDDLQVLDKPTIDEAEEKPRKAPTRRKAAAVQSNEQEHHDDKLPSRTRRGGRQVHHGGGEEPGHTEDQHASEEKPPTRSRRGRKQNDDEVPDHQDDHHDEMSLAGTRRGHKAHDDKGAHQQDENSPGDDGKTSTASAGPRRGRKVHDDKSAHHQDENTHGEDEKSSTASEKVLNTQNEDQATDKDNHPADQRDHVVKSSTRARRGRKAHDDAEHDQQDDHAGDTEHSHDKKTSGRGRTYRKAPEHKELDDNQENWSGQHQPDDHVENVSPRSSRVPRRAHVDVEGSVNEEDKPEDQPAHEEVKQTKKRATNTQEPSATASRKRGAARKRGYHDQEHDGSDIAHEDGQTQEAVSKKASSRGKKGESKEEPPPPPTQEETLRSPQTEEQAAQQTTLDPQPPPPTVNESQTDHGSTVVQHDELNTTSEESPSQKRGRNIPQRRAATVHHSYDETSDSDKPERRRKKPETPRKSLETAKSTHLDTLKSEASTVSSPVLTLSATTARGRTRKPTARVQQFLEEERAKAESPKKRVLLAGSTTVDTPSTKGKANKRGSKLANSEAETVGTPQTSKRGRGKAAPPVPEEVEGQVEIHATATPTPTVSKGRKATRKAKNDGETTEEPAAKKSPAELEAEKEQVSSPKNNESTPTRVAGRRNAAAAAKARIEEDALAAAAIDPPKRSRAKKVVAKATTISPAKPDPILASSTVDDKEQLPEQHTSPAKEDTTTKPANKRVAARRVAAVATHDADSPAVPTKKSRKGKAVTETHESDSESEATGAHHSRTTSRVGRKNVHFESADQNAALATADSNQSVVEEPAAAAATTTTKRATRARRK